ncbi:MAG TPA: hypothetical protein PK731_04015, partial [Verrucomicrobiota bacterium]|nr:hypothetical protein [Verrucomicrobiota bacterium]
EDKPPLAQPRWGYEGALATIVYGLPAWRWADDVEERVTAGIRHVMAWPPGVSRPHRAEPQTP